MVGSSYNSRARWEAGPGPLDLVSQNQINVVH